MSKPSILSRLFQKKSIQDLESDVEIGEGESGLTRNLSLFDLTCFGIAAVVGAGIFSTIGNAIAKGGPAVCLLFILTAFTCFFSALCYAEFASRIPVSGSAYTYSYAAFGELIAWLIGWNLLMEYAIGNSVIAFSWSDYLVGFIRGFRTEQSTWDIPEWLTTDYLSCWGAARDIATWNKLGGPTEPTEAIRHLASIYESAPGFANGWKLIVDVPALLINVLVTALVYIGIKESKSVSNLMVLLKLLVIVMVIAIGLFYVNPSNWIDFAPHGITGVLSSISSVFFAYIGFDAISTTAEECNNPQRDIPRATVMTLVLCTILYVILATVLTGMVPYDQLGVDDPLSYVFGLKGLKIIAGIVAFSAVIATTGVFLVFQLGQPRILMAMSRDGLLPQRFASVHPRYKTPAFSTIVTGIAVALPTIFMSSSLVLDLTSIGTLFAFTLVSAGILVIGSKKNDEPVVGRQSFRVPYINARFPMIGLFAGYCLLLWYGMLPSDQNVFAFLHELRQWSSDASLENLWLHPRNEFAYGVFFLVFLGFTLAAVIKQWSLIPILGVLTNLYLIAGLGVTNWIRFGIWCAIGFAVYFSYGFWNSRLSKQQQSNSLA